MRNKIIELRQRVADNNIDIVLVQESKLGKDSETPKIPGYDGQKTVRSNKEGGGLITYFKKSIIFEKKKAQIKDATESQSFAVKMSKSKWLTLTNVYCPPSSSQAHESLRLATETLPAGKDCIIAGDFNAHSILWDSEQPPDNRGTDVEDWAIENDLNILNDGSPTHVNRGTGGLSTPDISFCGKSWQNKTAWSVEDPIGNSDHNPILIEVHSKMLHVKTSDGSTRWKSREVDWDAFKEAVEEKVLDPEEAESLSMKERVLKFNEALIETAKTHVGKTKQGSGKKQWLTPTVRAAVRKRNALRRKVRTHRREWLEACKEANEEILKAKEESWREFLQDSISPAEEHKIWKVIRSLNGSPQTNSPNEAMVHKGKKITSPVAKANIFVEHYANVSKLKLTSEDRKLNRLLKKRLSNAANPNEVRLFTIRELKKAIKS